MAFAETLQRAYKSTVFDLFLLQRAERVVKSYPAPRQERLRELFEAGSRRSNAAADLLEGQPKVAALLYREAAMLFIAAILAVRDEDYVFGSGDAKIAFDKLDAVRSELPPPPSNFDRARSLLSDPDPLAFDRLSDTEALLAVSAVAATVNWLQDAIEPRTVSEIRRSRAFRLSLVAVAGLAILVWLGFLVFSSTNIARGKRVIASSRFPTSAAAEGGLTDGVIMSGYGVHTNLEDNPWVRIDLGDVYTLKKIKVYNRADGWQDEGLPLTLEVSENGVDFTPIDRRTSSFSQWSPWVYSAHGEKARFIQVHGAKGKYVALGELEAFGKK